MRGHRPAWRDPRLWIGVVLVAASVVAGARLLAAADDTVQVWAAVDALARRSHRSPLRDLWVDDQDERAEPETDTQSRRSILADGAMDI